MAPLCSVFVASVPGVRCALLSRQHLQSWCHSLRDAGPSDLAGELRPLRRCAVAGKKYGSQHGKLRRRSNRVSILALRRSCISHVRWDVRQEPSQALGYRQMRDDGVAKPRVWQVGQRIEAHVFIAFLCISRDLIGQTVLAV